MEEEVIKVLIAEDLAIVRMGYRLFFENYKNVQIIGEVENGRQALSFLEKQRPHILLLDLKMPQKEGAEILSEIRERFPFLKVIIISMYKDLRTIKMLIRLGARGYLSKNSSEMELLMALKTVKSGTRFFSSDIVDLMFRDQQVNKTESAVMLTKREKEIVELIRKGFTSREIGDKLYISLRTVECHRVNIFRKLKVKNVIELLAVMDAG
jgi:two-component system, NarL family, response regulator NreC